MGGRFSCIKSVNQDRTYVANASGSTLGVYYCPDRLTLEEMEIAVGTTLGSSNLQPPALSVSLQTKTVMKRDKCVRYLRIPPNKHGQILSEGAIFVTVYVEQNGSSDERLNISQNFLIPGNRSFIVTKDQHIMLQLYGGNIWVDEGGTDHST